MEKKNPKNWIEKCHDKLTAPKTIIWSGYLALTLFFGLMSLAILVAVLWGPGNYNLFDNWISDLGSINHTPAPFLLDSALVINGMLLIPFVFYLEKFLAPIPKSLEELPAPHRMAYRFMSLNFFFNILGCFSMVCVGLFSEDRDFGLHFPFSVLLFGSFAFGAIFLGLRITFMQQPVIPKPFNIILGIYAIFIPFTVGGIAGYHIFESTGYAILMEWILFFVLVGLIVPICFAAQRHAATLLTQEKET
ncbi:MAG: hypothetical protein ACTSQI_06725 [Candidatus Helarchaeota archaeon]